MSNLENEIRDKLECFMDTALAISGNTNDVELIEKELTKLLDQTVQFILEEFEKILTPKA